MANYPTDLRYTKDHEWARIEERIVRIGITSHAVDQLGDVTLVDLPIVGAEIQAGERFGDIESVKTVSELFAPVSGEVIEVNDTLEEAPEAVNEAPYEDGWMVAIRMSNPGELEALMDAGTYQEYVDTLDH